MLIDDHVETIKRGVVALNNRASAPPIQRLQHAHQPYVAIQTQRFVLSPQVVETLKSLSSPETIDRSREYIFAPAAATWIEWAGPSLGFSPTSNRHGLFIIGEGEHEFESIINGTTIYVSDVVVEGRRSTLGLSFEHDFFRADAEILTENRATGGHQRAVPQMRAISDTLDLRHMGAFMAAAFALIATPRVTDLASPDHRKINKRRLQRGAAPLIGWREVSLRVDALARPKTILGDEAPRHGVALHHVRSHLRMKTGRVEIVRQHWRGDPAIGMVRHRYAVKHTGETGAEWKGGKLPPAERTR